MNNDRTIGRTIAFCLVACLMVFSLVPPAVAGDEIPLDQSPLSQEYIVMNDPLTISGIVPGITELRVWIFGPDYAKVTTLALPPDGSFVYNISSKEIEKMESGNYTVVLQSQGENGKYDIALDERTGEVINTGMPYGNLDRVLFTLDQAKNMREAAPDALVRALKETAVDDGFAVYTFSIADPFIELNPVRDYYVGETITISGRTNIPAGDRIGISTSRGISSCKVTPGDIVTQGQFVTVVDEPTGLNTFSVDFNSSISPPAEYYVYGLCVDRECRTVRATFLLLEGPPPTTVPQTTEHIVITTLPTDITTPATTPLTTVPLPGILSIVALVVFSELYRRRN